MIVISVTLQVPPEELASFRPAIQALVTAARAEPGVLAYSFAEDMLTTGLVRIFEVYADQAALDAHHASPHFQAWRPKSVSYPRIERWMLHATART